MMFQVYCTSTSKTQNHDDLNCVSVSRSILSCLFLMVPLIMYNSILYRINLQYTEVKYLVITVVFFFFRVVSCNKWSLVLLLFPHKNTFFFFFFFGPRKLPWSYYNTVIFHRWWWKCTLDFAAGEDDIFFSFSRDLLCMVFHPPVYKPQALFPLFVDSLSKFMTQYADTKSNWRSRVIITKIKKKNSRITFFEPILLYLLID